MFRIILCWITLFCCISILPAQIKGTNPVIKKSIAETGIVRAVVVGISDYQNPKITDLLYADRDAVEFVKYLKSPAGGSIDSANIQLLTNSEATAGKFVAALYWLMEESKKGDEAIIYFSGHGDVENVTMNQPGFLLCWDSPARVYMGGGTFGLAYLQEIISTLSISTQAKVLMIADACHAGKLAGSNVNGSQATASNLSKQYASEVKILSCQPDEFSLEGKNWGNGRGVFSYYLLAGIQGFADRNKDGNITLQEIEAYLDDKVPASVAPHVQIPLTFGNKSTLISKVDEANFKNLPDPDAQSGISTNNSKGIELAKAYFKDSTIYEKYEAFQEALTTKHFLYPEEGSAYFLFNEIKNEPELANFVGLMKRNLASSLQDDAQQAINDYLQANPIEMKRRWSFDSTYNKFPIYLQKAAELLGEKHFYYKPLLARYHYFNGLNLRLKGEKEHDNTLIEKAIAEQKKCLEIESKASFALNEIGYCYQLLKNYQLALSYYFKCIEISPQWVLPFTNVTACYANLNEFKKAEQYGLAAISIDSSFLAAYQNLEVSYMRQDSLNKAKPILLQMIEIDSEYTDTYLDLGLVYFHETAYNNAKLALHKYVQANPKNVRGLLNLAYTYLKLNDSNQAGKYFFQAYNLEPDSLNTFQGLIEYYFYSNQMDKASELLNSYLLKYPTDGYAYYLLAGINAEAKDNKNSLLNLEKAFNNGFKDINIISTDKRFATLAKKKAFKQLKAKYFKN